MECSEKMQLSEEKEVHHKSITVSQNPVSNGMSSSNAIDDILLHAVCLSAQQNLREDFELKLENLRMLLAQKEDTITLLQRERNLLEKENQTAKKEKEETVLKFAIQEKLVIDAEQEKDLLKKQLLDAQCKMELNTSAFQAALDEKAHLTSVIDRMCKEMEKLKTECNHLDSKLKLTTYKLNSEFEARSVLGKKLEDYSNLEQVKMEYAAKYIVLTHEMDRKNQTIESLTSDLKRATEFEKQLKEQLRNITEKSLKMTSELEELQSEHNSLQSAYTEELLNSEKLRRQIEDLQLLKIQAILNEEKIGTWEQVYKDLNEKLENANECVQNFLENQKELLSLNKEMSESIATVKNDNDLLRCQVHGIKMEDEILRKEKLKDLAEQQKLIEKIKNEEHLKNRDRHLLTSHLCKKTKFYELTKMKLHDVMRHLEASTMKHNTLVKELKRELQKYKNMQERKIIDPPLAKSEFVKSTKNRIRNTKSSSECIETMNDVHKKEQVEVILEKRKDSIASERVCTAATSSGNLNIVHGDKVSVISNALALTENTLRQNEIKAASKAHLVERILRLQQLAARQAEKIDFLENHILSLISELQKKSHLGHYYTLRGQARVLTYTKSDQNKEEL